MNDLRFSVLTCAVNNRLVQGKNPASAIRSQVAVVICHIYDLEGIGP